MNTIYLITGPAGVGKSTISDIIANRLDKSVLIEGDTIYHLVVGGYVAPWKNGNYLNFFWENSINLVKNSLKNGFDVVFNYILDKKDVKKFKQEFKDYKIKFVCLLVDEKTILERDLLRPEDCRMGERCLVLLNSLKNKKFNENNILDSSNLTPEQTANIVLENDRFYI